MPRVDQADFKGFAQGLNREADPYLLEADESPNAVNVDFGFRGEVSRRMGYERVECPYDQTVGSQRIFTWSDERDSGLNFTYLIVLGGTDQNAWIGELTSDGS